MAHGGYGKRRVAGRKPSSSGGGSSHRSKGPGVSKKPKTVSIKNQIRSIERILRKELPPEVREAQEKKLEGLKKQQELHNRLALEHKLFLRDRKRKFFERRKIERKLRRLEKLQHSSSGPQGAEVAEEIVKLKEDLEYVRFFPKTEKYVALFSGDEDAETVDRRSRLRKQIKENIVAAGASGKDLEETGSEDDGLIDLSDDDFFAAGDEADTDDEMTDKSARKIRQREQASSALGKATTVMSGDERSQRQISARTLMPPPRPSSSSLPHSTHTSYRNGRLSSSDSSMHRTDFSTSRSRSRSSSSDKGPSNSKAGQSSNLSSNSDAHKPRRKRRPKKKKQQASVEAS